MHNFTNTTLWIKLGVEMLCYKHCVQYIKGLIAAQIATVKTVKKARFSYVQTRILRISQLS